MNQTDHIYAILLGIFLLLVVVIIQLSKIIEAVQ